MRGEERGVGVYRRTEKDFRLRFFFALVRGSVEKSCGWSVGLCLAPHAF